MTKRTHPPTLLKSTERTLLDACNLRRGDFVLCAVSGGPDSMALLHVLSKLAPRLGIGLEAHGVDHGLRAEAKAELACASAFARELGVAFASTQLNVPAGPNLMARARDARYAALRAALERARPFGLHRAHGRVIATGHHADDRAETVLLRLLRGSGPVGLAVMPARASDVIRPFIGATRTDIMSHLARHRVPYSNDPSNRDPRFLRTRVRAEVLPLLKELSPRIVEHLCALADALAEAAGDEKALVPSTFMGLPLGRAQRQALSRALRLRNPRVRVPLPGGKIAGVDLPSRRIVLMKDR